MMEMGEWTAAEEMLGEMDKRIRKVQEEKSTREYREIGMREECLWKKVLLSFFVENWDDFDDNES